MSSEKSGSTGSADVPNYSVVGFADKSSQIASAHASFSDLKALRLSVCVGASYNSDSNKICFKIPIYGDFCVASPVPIPIDAEIKACAETCGQFIPTGLKATIYLNGNSIWSGNIAGSC